MLTFLCGLTRSLFVVQYKYEYPIMDKEVSVEAQQSGIRYVAISTSLSHARRIDPSGTFVTCHLTKVIKPKRAGVLSAGLGGGRTLIHLLILASLILGKSDFLPTT